MRVADRALVAAAALAAGCAGAEPFKYRNVTAGGDMRHGVYGRIEVGRSPPPPVIHPAPQVGSHALVPKGTPAVYLYVPSGQVRKLGQHCHKWKACDVPVLFVRMDDSPGRLGAWKQLRMAQHD